MKSQLKLALMYFAVVFGAGFALGTVRILLLVPRMGVRLAELSEIPLMILVTILAARWIIRRYRVPERTAARLAVGIPALLLLLVAEFGVAVGLRGMSLSEAIASRDAVTGPIYYLSLGLFGLMPLLVERRKEKSDRYIPAMIDRFISNPDVAESHEVVINAPADLVFQVAEHFDLQSIPVVHAIFTLRERLMRVRPPKRTGPKGIVAETLALGWGKLAGRPGRELVMGAVTQPWMGEVKFRAVPENEFAAFSEPDVVKIAWTLEAEPLDEVTTRFRTQTRVLATDDVARRKFRRYWRWAGYGIVMIRWFINRELRREAQRQASSHKEWLVANPNYSATLAAMINAPPEAIWPWLVQMGYRRGGLYSYDWLDRIFGYLDRPSAERVLPEFQTLAVGDVIPIGRGNGFPVQAIEPYRRLVLGGTASEFRWIWQFELCPVGINRTRLISRNSAQVPSSFGRTAFVLMLKPAAFIMTRRMLVGIKRRAELLATRHSENDLQGAA